MGGMGLFARVGESNPPATSTGWMNPARSLAIIAVVAIHAIGDTVETRYTDFGTASWWLANAIDSSARWSVPVFLMIAGALALDPVKGGRPREFLLKRVFRIGIPLVVWTVVYVLFRLYYMGGRESDWDPIVAIVSGSPFVQLYFLYVLAGLTLLTPFMRLLSTHGSRRLQWATALILLGIGMADEIFTSAFGIGELNAATRFLPMMGFYVLGWVMRDWVLTRRQAAVATAVFVSGVLATFLWAGFGPGEKPWKFSYEYLSPMVVAMSLSGYLLLHFSMRSGFTLLHRIYPYSFGVFLLHPLLLFPMRTLIGGPVGVGDVALHGLVLPIVYTVVCTVLTVVALRIPLVRAAFGEGRPPRAWLRAAADEDAHAGTASGPAPAGKGPGARRGGGPGPGDRGSGARGSGDPGTGGTGSGGTGDGPTAR